MSKYLFLPFVDHYLEEDSFHTSIANACIYKGLEIPLRSFFNKDKKECIQSVGLSMENGNNIKKIFESGGIITFKHKLTGEKHSCLLIRDEKKTEDEYVLINSWYGPTILTGISEENIENVFNIVEGWNFVE
ncbi:hypothetical protein COB55_05995 [Candidatus Wolfebacteria bacterium]|nr:MAG: hypothetical protein COB55_05995 [Candidatus Wolfebacteria bacterium]